MAFLVIEGPEGTRKQTLEAHNKLGRHPDNTIQILDRIVSKEHCHIDQVNGQWVLKDLGSLNGTYMGKDRVGTHALRSGDVFSMGSTQITFQAEDRGPSQSPSPKVSSGVVVGGARGAVLRGGQGQKAQDSGDHRRRDPEAAGDTVESQAPEGDRSRVTLSPQRVESHIHSRIQPIVDQAFQPETQVTSESHLRSDYEKLRVSYEVIRTIGVELDIRKLSEKILDCAFQLLKPDRGVVLLHTADEALWAGSGIETEGGLRGEGALHPVCVRSRDGKDEEVVLSSTITSEVLRDRAGILSSDASMDARFEGAHSIIMQGIRSTMAVPLLYSGQVLGMLVVDSQVATNAFTDKDLELFQNIANQAAIAVQNSLFAGKLEREARTRQRFERLLSPAIAEQVVSGKVEIQKSGELRDTTILFTDIRGFTAMGEAHSPQSIVDMLNEYFEQMVEIIFRHEGTLDKFVGDEIMALFGSPVSHVDDAERAVRTAVEMFECLKVLNETRTRRGEPPMEVGAGISSGEVVAGYLGSSRALEYTVIGDVVNTGARLCSKAGPGEILVGESTYDRIRDSFECELLPPTQVKGKAKPLNVYRVVHGS